MNEMLWNPTIVHEDHFGVKEIDLRAKLLTERKIFLTGEINSLTVNAILLQLMYLEGSGSDDINLYINSGGGEVNAGLMLYDVLQDIKVPLNTYCTGLAASMAAVILAGGQKGRRFILPHSKTMIHEPLIAGGAGGSASSIKNIADSILETRSLCNSILAKHTGKSIEEINSATSFDNYMNAEESVAFGLCDSIVAGCF
jgi:ATP-dependent Clp protease protease subunit